MWKLPINFVTLHYAHVLLCTILTFVIVYPYGNLRAVDAFFFAASANTESGLNTVDVKALKTYQQLAIYFFPIVTNLGFINILVVVVRLHWFKKRLAQLGPSLLRAKPPPGPKSDSRDVESHTSAFVSQSPLPGLTTPSTQQSNLQSSTRVDLVGRASVDDNNHGRGDDRTVQAGHSQCDGPPSTVTWAEGTGTTARGRALRIPSPREREKGLPLEEVDADVSDEDDGKISFGQPGASGRKRQHSLSRATTAANSLTLERIASSIFVIGDTPSQARPLSSRRSSGSKHPNLPSLSPHVTVGRNSEFCNLTPEDREKLGGIEYRSLKLLLKIVIGYFFGLHLFGALCLTPWIHTAPAKYQEYLTSQGQDKTWWAFYSAQTMVNNLGFTLTPDSMISFADATWPMLVMSFLAYAGNTCYPIFLRLLIWTFSKIVPKAGSLQEPLRYLLDHPRRCYTLLFPSRPTWILLGILFGLNFIDTLLIVVLDLHNPAVNSLAPGHRVLAAIFQAASSRHTGTATFNLADVNPAVQFSLLVMMYIAVFPIAVSIRSSNTYEDRALGKYAKDAEAEDTQSSSTYLVNHMRAQLSFDLWYIFLGIFCICIAESSRIADVHDPAFSVFSIFFEVVSAYANVGLSLGYPTVLTSLSGQFTTFSKLVICIMMIRGRHRGLPYALDRALVLPGEDLVGKRAIPESPRVMTGQKLKRWHTN